MANRSNSQNRAPKLDSSPNSKPSNSPFQLALPTRILNSTSFLSRRCTESFRVLFFPPPSHPRTTSLPSTNRLSQRPLQPGDKCTLVFINECNLAYPPTMYLC